MQSQLIRSLEPQDLYGEQRVSSYAIPSIRYLGSKRRVLPELEKLFGALEFSSALDLFTGSGAVAWLLKGMGKTVYSNDALSFPVSISSALLGAPLSKLDLELCEDLASIPGSQGFVSNNYLNVFFDEHDCGFIDALYELWSELPTEVGAHVKASLCVAAIKKRPHGMFTQRKVGNTKGPNSNEGMRVRDLYLQTVHELASARLSGPAAQVYRTDAQNLCLPNVDLVYLDPPYPSKFSDSNYLRRYHFLEGLLRGWENVEVDYSTLTNQVRVPFRRLDEELSSMRMFEAVFDNYKNSTWVISCSSSFTFSWKYLAEMIAERGRKVAVHKINLTYSQGSKRSSDGTLNNQAEEYLIVSKRG